MRSDRLTKLLKLARLVLRGDFTNNFDTNDALEDDGEDEDVDVGEQSLFLDTKNDKYPSPAQRAVQIPDHLRTKPELIDLVKKGRN